MGGSSYGGPELLGADAYVASWPDPGDAGETAGQPGRGAEPPLNFTVAPGKGKSKDGNYISQEAQWLASGGVETERGRGPAPPSLGTIRKPPSLSERLQRLQRLRALRAARTQPTGACSSVPSFPSPSHSRNASGGPGTAHRPALGAERDWPDTRCQVSDLLGPFDLQSKQPAATGTFTSRHEMGGSP
ncbi:hypothetical protein mRhiFer1_009902 [Rhinolophus ferrumequinum]|uniref:Uncharacterized protein n=1 Tax=Rhinolophus ferrumequinum TaxID=59479 RepID=A0A7J7YIM3_RHIFE|nr:hypothetical protein mRhiFer1_009902 [Rhinolophus ferrumequinum]